MRKVLIILMTSIVLLSGCSGIGNGPINTIKTMYTAAMENDMQTFSKIMSQADEFYGYEEETMEVVAEYIMEKGGVDNLKLTEIKKKQVNDEVASELTEEFADQWTLVAEQMEEDNEELMVWLLTNVDGNYYVYNGEDMSPDEFLKMP